MDIRHLSPEPDAEASASPRVPPPRRRWLLRGLLPALVLLLTAGVLAYAAREALWPAKSVRVVRVVAIEGGPTERTAGETAPAAGSVQAPGWVEPDPYPTYVGALANGIIRTVLALEGDSVQAGQVVAEMVEDDARLGVARAEAELARRRARLEAAQVNWQNPVALERAVAVHRAQLAEVSAELVRLEAAIAEQVAKAKELQTAYDRVARLLPDSAAELEVEQAQYRLEAQRAMVQATRQQRPVLEARASRYQAEVKAAEADLRLRVVLRQDQDEARASVAEAQAALDEAGLTLSRMKITSPVSGVVMRRLVAPGAKVMLGMDNPHSAHAIHVYDPKHLQVRVDVPLADAAKVSVGQPASIVVEVLPGREFSGKVTRFVHEADISKNTVEVKVAIEDPSPLLKPDMLARVKFPGGKSGGGTRASASAGWRVFVPRSAVAGEGDGAHVWVVTPGGSRLRRQPVQVGEVRDDGWAQVLEGLSPGDVLVAHPDAELVEGQVVSVAGEVEVARDVLEAATWH